MAWVMAHTAAMSLDTSIHWQSILDNRNTFVNSNPSTLPWWSTIAPCETQYDCEWWLCNDKRVEHHQWPHGQKHQAPGPKHVEDMKQETRSTRVRRKPAYRSFPKRYYYCFNMYVDLELVCRPYAILVKQRRKQFNLQRHINSFPATLFPPVVVSSTIDVLM